MANRTPRDADPTRVVHVALGLVVAACGGVLTAKSLTGLDYLGQNNTPGPGFFPALVSGMLGVLGLWLALAWLLAPPSGDEAKAQKLSLVPSELLRVLITWGGLAGFVALIDPLGFLLAGEIFTVFLIVVVERLRDWRIIVVLLLLPPATYWLFARLLEVQLPGGTLWSS